MKKLLNGMALLLALALAMACVPGVAFAEEAEPEGDALFEQWNPDALALNALVEYVEAVTDPDSPDFIPEADRIATFDMDGTLMAELAPTYLEVMLLTERILRDASYEPDEEMLEFGRMTRDHALDKSFPSDYDYEFSYHQARAFAGMTLNEYADFITRFLVHEADGFEGMTYADAYYLPMVEVVDYLRENGFKCYVVSGSDRFIARTFIEGAFDIPAECVIGSDTALEARDQGDTDGIEYVFSGGDELVRTDRLLVKDLKTNKVLQIAQEIGRQPVLSFGNSSGDVSMNNFALLNNRYRSAAFMLIADDGERDYGNPDNRDALTEKWQGMGYNVISMRDDWRTIYGEDVIKTGEFRWLNDYADDTAPSDGAEDAGESDAAAGFSYENDPRDNPNAMKDIVVNPDAVYGFSPSPDSTRLKDYVDAIDWTDPDQVAEARAQRQAYHDSLSELYRMIEDMLLEGKDVEAIARAVSQRRNELRLEASADDPEALELVKKSNLETYGDEMGPSADSLYEKYGSWQTVLEKALGTNPGMDACLGFYDEYYDLYDIEAAPRTQAAAQ